MKKQKIQYQEANLQYKNQFRKYQIIQRILQIELNGINNLNKENKFKKQMIKLVSNIIFLKEFQLLEVEILSYFLISKFVIMFIIYQLLLFQMIEFLNKKELLEEKLLLVVGFYNKQMNKVLIVFILLMLILKETFLKKLKIWLLKNKQ
ncbi:hypothetical protein IMG5_053620 [Ichthyophthirius multifiliis]|uniref:Transmembrane protein n=1 Tax=Ichthyophthirius multifiliis TaxID=5932 RepID=G0QMY3_ICHMU|nr:hypothetical protein IMG5_053620 [Ichthyophthirius multifiliis]EGR33422.1 hypothetical protein IMG5_053620 [Ichthyophthirius multifiliis]|eukprot:XP_004037408.1 hypothetical protein IMG5_053620 [Ichthyophthirius multifiliis]